MLPLHVYPNFHGFVQDVEHLDSFQNVVVVIVEVFQYSHHCTYHHHRNRTKSIHFNHLLRKTKDLVLHHPLTNLDLEYHFHPMSNFVH